MSLPSKPHVQSLAVVVHGGLDYGELARLGLKPEDVVDFSVNSNPFGPPQSAREAIAKAAIDRYPDSEASELRRRLAIRHGVEIDNIMVTNGSVEAIWSTCLAYLGPGDRVLVCGPTFGEYEAASHLMGGKVIDCVAREEDGFRPDTGRILGAIAEHKPKAVFICNPNNPTGTYLSRRGVEAILSACPDSLLVLDEAYVDFVQSCWQSSGLIHHGNLVILRSMTKDFALAGLRLGYAMAQAEIISSLRKARPPWSVNAVAQAAGIAALSEEGFLQSCLGDILSARDYLIREFRRLGYPVVETHANFFIAKVGKATEFRARLLKKDLLVRDCTSFGLPEYVRVAPRRMEDCVRLVRTVEDRDSSR